jgi:hypothetical protein
MIIKKIINFREFEGKLNLGLPLILGMTLGTNVLFEAET